MVKGNIDEQHLCINQEIKLGEEVNNLDIPVFKTDLDAILENVPGEEGLEIKSFVGKCSD